MAKKTKNISEKKWIKHYMKFVLENNKAPANIHQFTKTLGAKEKEFYAHFSSFNELEAKIFLQFFKKTTDLLNKNNTYSDFEPQHKLLSFYFTFFELLTENRSFVVFALKKECNKLKTVKKLELLRKAYMNYISNLKIDTPNLKMQNEDILQKGLSKLAWGQFILTLKYWLNDTSPDFENTDIYIEKSLQASFKIIEPSALESILDFGKFLFKEGLSKAQ